VRLHTRPTARVNRASQAGQTKAAQATPEERDVLYQGIDSFLHVTERGKGGWGVDLHHLKADDLDLPAVAFAKKEAWEKPSLSPMRLQQLAASASKKWKKKPK
jgi:hypothetical protein